MFSRKERPAADKEVPLEDVESGAEGKAWSGVKMGSGDVVRMGCWLKSGKGGDWVGRRTPGRWGLLRKKGDRVDSAWLSGVQEESGG